MKFKLIIKILKYFILLIAFFLPSFLKILLYKIVGFKINKRVKVGIFSLILVEHCELDDDVRIDPLTLICYLKLFRLGKKSRIAYFTVIYGYGSFEAEQRCLVSINCLIESSLNQKILMKEYSCFGPKNTIYTHGFYLPILAGFPYKRGDVIIGEYSWTGMCTTILPNTDIGSRVIIAPGAVITGTVEDNKFVRPFSYKYETLPIENKMNKYSSKQIICYIKNITSIAANKLHIDNYDYEQLFKKSLIHPTENYYDKKIIFYDNEFQNLYYLNNSIIIGYNLPENIKQNKSFLWLDFKDYSAYCESDKAVLKLVNNLYEKCHLLFLFVSE